MQIYTKILIGMVVGAVVGFTLGPTSPFLDHDVYTIDDASQARLGALDSTEANLQLPRVPLRLHVLETVRAKVADTSGALHDVPDRVRVRFEVTEALALQDRDGTLRARLGAKTVGDDVEAWLHLKHVALATSVVTTPTPVSGLGDWVLAILRPLGVLFMRLISMVIVPLVFASLLVGVASLGDLRKLGRLGGRTLVLYLATTAAAVAIGIACAQTIKPARFVDEEDRAALQASFQSAAERKVDAAATAPSALDNVLSIVPKNPVQSLASGDMLPIIFFAMIFGVSLTMLGASEARLVISFFDKVQQAMVIIIHMVMALAPFGVAALLAEVVGTSGLSVLGALVVYGLTVLLGLALHTGLVYGGLARFVARVPIPAFLRAIRPAQLMAFSTSSSSATLPVTMEVAVENLRVNKAVASFVLPLGSTVNMDGTALYQGVAAIFIAQVFQIDLSVGQQLGIVLTATMASIGAAGVPGAGMVTLAMVLTSAGIPTVGVALILGVDRILDMFRTAVNVTGDLVVASVMSTAEGQRVDPLTPEADLADPDHGFEGRVSHPPEAVDPRRP